MPLFARLGQGFYWENHVKIAYKLRLGAMGKILVTGATGFIGGHIVRALRAAGEEVVCLVRPSSDRRALEAAGAMHAFGDLGDAESLYRVLPGVSGVIHAAAMLKAPWRANFGSVNVNGTASLAAACAAQPEPPVLVVVSSLAAAGPAPSTQPRTETVAPSPISIYGRVKLEAENAAAALADELPVSIVRPPMVFGEGDRSALALYKFARSGWQPLPGNPLHRVSMIHAADLADLLLAVLRGGERVGYAAGSGVYYASADEMPALGELGALVAAAIGRPPPRVIPVPLAVLRLAATFGELKGRITDTPQLMNLDKAHELSSGPWLCSAQKARRDLGWAPLPLMARLQQTGHWYQQQGWLAP